MKDKFKLLFKTHYAILILCLFIGTISSLPRYIATKNVPNFHGVYNEIVGDQAFYEARAKDVLDGHLYLTNPYLYEHKNDFPMQFWIPDYILARPIGWLGVSIPQGFILWNFVLTALLALLSYVALFILTRSRPWSLLGVAVLHLILFNGDFIRIPSPGLNFVFWLLTFIFFLLFLNKEKLSYAILASLSFGILFNIYPYYWTFFVVLFSIFIASSFILRIKDFPYKKIFLVICGGLIVGIPYFISVFQSSKSPWYDQTLARLGLIHTHFPSGLSILIISLLTVVLFLYLYFKKEIYINKLNIFLFSGVLAGAIVVNQHVITGKNLEFSNHYFMCSVFWCVFVIIYLLFMWHKKYPEKFKKISIIFIGIIIIILSSTHTSKLITLEMTYMDSDIYAQNYKPIFDWLNSNTELDTVVFANDNLSYYIPIYTSNNIYFNGHSILFFMSNEEANSRFVINHYFDNFSSNYVVDKQRMIFGGYYINEYKHNLSKNKIRKLFGMKPVEYTFIPSQEIERIIKEGNDIKKESFDKVLQSYRVDYVIWDSNVNPEWKLNNFKFLKQVYSANGLIVYSIK